MKNRLKIVIIGTLFCCLQWLAFGQTTIWSEDFEGDVSGWSLNVGGSGSNTWIINNVKDGNGLLGGLLFSKPTDFSPGSGNNYMHIHTSESFDAVVFGSTTNFPPQFSAVYNAKIYSNVDAISPQISTGSNTGVKLSYYWLGKGMSSIGQGKIYYSVDDGSTWVELATHHSQDNWQLAVYTIPDLDAQSQIRLKFNWINAGNNVSGEADPAFSIDDIRLYKEDDDDPPPPPPPPPPPSPSVTLSGLTPLQPLELCHGYNFGNGSGVTVNVTGTINSGNNYIVELSNVSGDFSSPTVLATIASTSIGNGVTLGPLSIPNSTSLAPGTGYKVRVRSTDIAGISDSIPFTIHPIPEVTWGFTSPHTICNNVEELQLTASATPSGGQFTYSGTGVSGTIFKPSVAGLGTHEDITVSYESVDGCSKTEELKIIVEECNCDNTLVLSSSLTDTIVCGSEFKVPEGILSNVQGNVNWTTTNGTLDNSSSNTPTLTVTDEKLINYKLTVSDPCGGQASINVKLISPPVVTIETTDPCVVPKIVHGVSVDSLHWETGGGGTALTFGNDSSYVLFGELKTYVVKVTAGSGTYWLKYNTISENGSPLCSYTDSIEIKFPDTPSVQIQDDSICPGGAYQLYASGSENNLIYTWNTGYVGNPLIVSEAGVYSVKVKNECYESAESNATIYLKTCETDEIPNVIALSSLHGNNSWYVPNFGAKEFQCLIFNRWGSIVFELKDNKERWYGKDKSGNILPQGVYFYKMIATYDNGKQETKHGFINLVF